jgi:hypothetical protein
MTITKRPMSATTDLRDSKVRLFEQLLRKPWQTRTNSEWELMTALVSDPAVDEYMREHILKSPKVPLRAVK